MNTAGKETQSRKVRVAAVQMAPDLDGITGTLNRVLAATADAADRGAQLVVFPETLLPWYPYFSYIHPAPAEIFISEHLRLYENAVVVPGPVTDAAAAAAKRHGIVIVLGVNERDHSSLYNTQLIFDADGSLKLKRRKITPTFQEKMIWGQGDGAGLRVVDTSVGRVGALACAEHFNPLARFALISQHEEIHIAQFPGSVIGQSFSDRIEVSIRNHAMESGCFVVNATGWLTEEQVARISPDEKTRKLLSGGCMTAIIAPDGTHVVPPLTSGEGMLVADLDMSRIIAFKRIIDSAGHYARPELLSLNIDHRPTAPAHATAAPLAGGPGGQTERMPGGRPAETAAD